jgi:uncharacterized membrane protein
MKTFSIEAALRFGWETFKKRPAFFAGMAAIVFIVSMVIDAITRMTFGEVGLQGFVGGIISFAVATLVDLGVVATLLKAYDDVNAADFKDLWHPDQYVPYLIASIIMGIAVGIGLILLIIPGIIIAVILMFTKFVVIDRKLSPIDALKESARITTGHRVNLFLFMVVIVVLNIIGALALLVGLLVTVPVSALAMVYLYRTLGHQASEVVATATPAAPAAEPTTPAATA